MKEKVPDLLYKIGATPLTLKLAIIATAMAVSFSPFPQTASLLSNLITLSICMIVVSYRTSNFFKQKQKLIETIINDDDANNKKKALIDLVNVRIEERVYADSANIVSIFMLIAFIIINNNMDASRLILVYVIMSVADIAAKYKINKYEITIINKYKEKLDEPID